MTQPIQLKQVRKKEIEKALQTIEQELDGLRSVLRTVLQKLHDVNGRKNELEDRLSELDGWEELAQEERARELEQGSGVFFRLFRRRDDP